MSSDVKKFIEDNYGDINNWLNIQIEAMRHTAYATSKKEAKRYAAYLMLCDYFGLPDEFDEEDETDE